MIVQKFSGLFRNRRLCLRRNHLDYIVCDLVAPTVAPNVAGARPWARMPALNVTETNAVALQEDSWSPHEREVCRKSQIHGKLFFR